jgi:hypothetical protein
MPVFRLGDLVRLSSDVFVLDPDAVGLILEMRAGPMHPEANVMWSDMPEPRWIHMSSLALVQPEGPVVE